MMKEKLQRLLDDKGTPEWCALLELVTEQIGNYLIGEWDYDLAEKYHPDIITFTMDDFEASKTVEEIPEDWLRYAYACMERIGL